MLLKFSRNFEKFQFFWDYLENPLRYVSVPGDKKVTTHDKKTFDEVIFDLPFLAMEG